MKVVPNMEPATTERTQYYVFVPTILLYVSYPYSAWYPMSKHIMLLVAQVRGSGKDGLRVRRYKPEDREQTAGEENLWAHRTGSPTGYAVRYVQYLGLV